MDIQLMPAQIEDLPAINRIQKLAFRDSYDQYGFCPAFEAEDEHLIAYLEWARIYKIVLEGHIIGSVFIYKAEENHYELDSISLAPEYQNNGLGSRAILMIENRHPDALLWTLSTPASDERNRHYYEKLGFAPFDSEYINNDLVLIRYKKEK